MSIVLLNMVLVTVFLCIAAFLTLVALALIIISLIRSSRAKKKGKKTAKVGLWIGSIMLILPWLCIGVLVIAGKVYDRNNNRMDVDREILAQAVTDDDPDALYDLLSEDMLTRNGLSEEDLEEFLSQCDISNISEEDMERYTEFSSPDNHYRNYTTDENGRTQLCFQYNMYDVNDSGGDIYIAGVDGDPEGAGYVGIYYITYTLNDTTITFGEMPPKEP